MNGFNWEKVIGPIFSIVTNCSSLLFPFFLPAVEAVAELKII